MAAADKTHDADAPPDGESFVQRWARRKHEARQAPVAADPAGGSMPVVTESQPPTLTDADMPPLDSLGEDSDFSPFLSPGVSEALRRQALRRLFALPSVNQRCPLDGEWYDLRDCEPLGDIVTVEMREAFERETARARDRIAERLNDHAEKIVRDNPPAPEEVVGNGTPSGAERGPKSA